MESLQKEGTPSIKDAKKTGSSQHQHRKWHPLKLGTGYGQILRAPAYGPSLLPSSPACPQGRMGEYMGFVPSAASRET